jgi:hypothetical protein
MKTQPDAADCEQAVTRFLAQFSTTNRAEAIHLALQALRARVEPDRVLACELAWEVHCHGYWSQVCRADGTAYDCEETYFREVLGLASWRTAYKRLAIGRMLLSFGELERPVLRAAIAEVGLAKAAVVAPAIERFREPKAWLQLALQCSTAMLQARVSEALEALPRGREQSQPGERFRRDVLAADAGHRGHGIGRAFLRDRRKGSGIVPSGGGLPCGVPGVLARMGDPSGGLATGASGPQPRF